MKHLKLYEDIKEGIDRADDFDWSDEDFDYDEKLPVVDPYSLNFPVQAVVTEKFRDYIDIHPYWMDGLVHIIGEDVTILRIIEAGYKKIGGKNSINRDGYLVSFELRHNFINEWFIPFDCIDLY